jgi:hypothetical protein
VKDANFGAPFASENSFIRAGLWRIKIESTFWYITLFLMGTELLLVEHLTQWNLKPLL